MPAGRVDAGKATAPPEKVTTPSIEVDVDGALADGAGAGAAAPALGPLVVVSVTILSTSGKEYLRGEYNSSTNSVKSV